MSQLKSLTVLALAAAGLLAAGCSSSSSSSSSVPAATSPPASATAAATSPSATPPAPSSPAPSTPAASTPALAAGGPSAADCKIIKPISASAISKLTPISTLPKAQAIAGMTAYIATLKAAEAKMTTTGGKKVIADFAADLQKSETESTSKATTLMIGALGTLGKACS